MKRREKLICLILMAGAIYSAVATIIPQWQLRSVWQQLAPEKRDSFVLGPFAPLVRQINAQVPPDESILLVSTLDPGLLPYMLFPRKIWQMQTDPETNALFMDLPISAYPHRMAESFPAQWRLDVQLEDSKVKGELKPLHAKGDPE